jgi:UDP-2,4-diacetamido-2,4,6-trideoxy-beta-L-altropyranose hydrolase
MKAVLRCDASPRIGSGHLSRCLTLARGLLAEGFVVEVATHAPSEHTRAWIAREGCSVVDAGAGSDVTAAEGAALVVVDGYDFPPSFHEALRRDDRLVCVIDDLAAAPVRGDVVLNGNLYAEELVYDVPAGAVLLCGPRYALVREEFVAARAAREARAWSEEASRLLITMGGADPTRETEKALAALEHTLLTSPLDVKVVVGAANPRSEAIRHLAAAQTKHRVEVLVDVRAMGALMEWCDVALSAAGGTCLELSCVGVAAAAVVVADNQRGVGGALRARGLMDVVGLDAGEAVDAAVLAGSVARLLADAPRRRAMELAQRACVDGAGRERAAARLAMLVRER